MVIVLAWYSGAIGRRKGLVRDMINPMLSVCAIDGDLASTGGFSRDAPSRHPVAKVIDVPVTNWVRGGIVEFIQYVQEHVSVLDSSDGGGVFLKVLIKCLVQSAIGDIVIGKLLIEGGAIDRAGDWIGGLALDKATELLGVNSGAPPTGQLRRRRA